MSNHSFIQQFKQFFWSRETSKTWRTEDSGTRIAVVPNLSLKGHRPACFTCSPALQQLLKSCLLSLVQSRQASLPNSRWLPQPLEFSRHENTWNSFTDEELKQNKKKNISDLLLRRSETLRTSLFKNPGSSRSRASDA